MLPSWAFFFSICKMGGSKSKYFLEFVEGCVNMACTVDHAAGQSRHEQSAAVRISTLVSAL